MALISEGLICAKTALDLKKKTKNTQIITYKKKTKITAALNQTTTSYTKPQNADDMEEKGMHLRFRSPLGTTINKIPSAQCLNDLFLLSLSL